ncbi:MAG: Card1-like endonuclease domain-containing protein [Pseudomonadota bacterium]
MPIKNPDIINQYSTHLVFADREMTPNLGPILDERLVVKNVLIAYTPNFFENAKRLKSIYNAHKIKAELLPIEPAFEINDIVSELKNLVKGVPYEQLAINISCAGKMYTLSVFKAFENSPVGLYYLLPNDQFKWIQPNGLPEFNIDDSIELEEFLHAHGIEQMEAVKLTPSQANFANELVNAIQKIILQQNALSIYQVFSTRFARGKSLKLVLRNEHYYLEEINTHTRIKADLLVGFLRKLHNQNIVCLNIHDTEISPSPEKDGWKRTFFEGGWLEYLTYRTVLELKAEIPTLKDIAFGVKLHRENAHDEADVLFIANNQLFVVECKTGANVNVSLHLQRLDSLKTRLGGTTAHGLLVTTEDIGANLNKANLLNIGVIDRKQLTELTSHLKEWILNEISHSSQRRS